MWVHKKKFGAVKLKDFYIPQLNVHTITYKWSTVRKIFLNPRKGKSLCHKFKFFYPYIFAT